MLATSLLTLLAVSLQAPVEVRDGLWKLGGNPVQLVGICQTEKNTPPVDALGRPLKAAALAQFELALDQKLIKRPWKEARDEDRVTVLAVFMNDAWRDVRSTYREMPNMSKVISKTIKGHQYFATVFSVDKGATCEFRYKAGTGKWTEIAKFGEDGKSSNAEVQVDLQKRSKTAVRWTKSKKEEIPLDAYRGRARVPGAYHGWEFELSTNDPKAAVDDKNVDTAALFGASERGLLEGGRTELEIVGRAPKSANLNRMFTLKGRQQTDVVFVLPIPK